MRISHYIRFVIATLFVTLAVSTVYLPRVQANTLIVTNLNDSGEGSLRATIASAIAGDTINFDISGTIILTSGEIGIDKNLTIDGTGQNISISGNHTQRILSTYGGAIIAIRNLSLIDGTFPNVQVLAGCAINNGNAQLTIDNVIFSGHKLDGRAGGAGIAIVNTGTMTINYSTFSNNFSMNSGTGGAILNTGTMTINHSNFNDNFVTGTQSTGGAIVNNGTMTINDSSFTNNSVNATDGKGGAIHNNANSLTINNSTFSGNSATNGGAISGRSGTLTIRNSTFSGNSATTSGGAIYVNFETGFSINTIFDSSTFANNTASTGAHITHLPSSITISRSIFNGGSCSGTLTDGGNNIAFNAVGCVGIDVNPLLGALGNYGGTTQTIPLLVGSPAIDAYSTNCTATDQRGITRPQGEACDIGAFEVVPIIITEATVTENEFFAALNAARTGYPDISSIIVDFVPNGINLTLITNSGTVGVVSFQLTQAEGFTTFTINNITVNGAAAPDSYLTIINRDLPNILTTALDALVVERFGSLIDIDTITIDASSMTINTAP